MSEKESARRYQSAAALGEDVQRYLTDQPILARPPSTAYQFRKLVRRHKGPFAAAAGAFVLLLAFSIAMTVQAVRIGRERDRANREAETARRVSEFVDGLFKAADPWAVGDKTVSPREILDRGAARLETDLQSEPGVQRVDRVDRIGDQLVVIDYKSGAVRKAPWRGARMEAPQLPLYAVLHPGRPAAIAIAELDAERAGFMGVSHGDGIIATLVPAPEFELNEDRETGFDWPVIKEHWFAWLERLARDHASGHAEVDPKLAADTCRHCHLDALCRVAAIDPDEAGAGEVGDDN